jgi:pimeloyl-ACP methyl ester carboxylesterase
MPEFFQSMIYHPDPKDRHHPTFALLSNQPGFGIEQVKDKILQTPITYFFILVNGQQIPALDENESIDRFFGRKLTGIHRLRGRHHGVWDWEYRIFNASSAFPSVASTLFEVYGDRALILDVLDAKYDWEEPAADNDKALHNLNQSIGEILEQIKACQQIPPTVFICGYSRGGVFSLRLAGLLKSQADITGVVTIDPVIAPWKEADNLVTGWGAKKGESWGIAWQKKSSSAFISKDSFPILKNPGLKCYNVFQRRAFMAMNHILEKPIGSAVENAKAPAPANHWDLKSAGPEPHCAQYDLAVESHATMVEKYAFWALEIVKTNCP